MKETRNGGSRSRSFLPAGSRHLRGSPARLTVWSFSPTVVHFPSRSRAERREERDKGGHGNGRQENDHRNQVNPAPGRTLPSHPYPSHPVSLRPAGAGLRPVTRVRDGTGEGTEPVETQPAAVHRSAPWFVGHPSRLTRYALHSPPPSGARPIA